MRLPRDVAGTDLVKAPARPGYRVTRKASSHVRLTFDFPKQHHVTVPAHDPLKLGTLAGILGDIAAHHGMTREALVQQLFSEWPLNPVHVPGS